MSEFCEKCGVLVGCDSGEVLSVGEGVFNLFGDDSSSELTISTVCCVSVIMSGSMSLGNPSGMPTFVFFLVCGVRYGGMCLTMFVCWLV